MQRWALCSPSRRPSLPWTPWTPPWRSGCWPSCGNQAAPYRGGDLQSKNQLFDVSQVNYVVITIYKHGGKRIFGFWDHLDRTHLRWKFENPHFGAKNQSCRKCTHHGVLSQNMRFRVVFGLFLETGKPDWAESFFIGFLPFSHKFWYVTPYTFDNFDFWPHNGDFQIFKGGLRGLKFICKAWNHFLWQTDA